MATDIDNCSKALLKIGEEAISSFDDDNERSATCGALYPDFAKHCLSLHTWNFARKKVQLARLVDVPLNEWKYAYQLPSDVLKLNAVYTSDGVSVEPTVEYDIFYKQVYFNHTECYIDYIAEIPETDWPAWFTEFVCTAFAAELAFPITNQQQLHDSMWMKAYGPAQDNGRGGLLGTCMRIDSQQIPPKLMRYNSIIKARFGGFDR